MGIWGDVTGAADHLAGSTDEAFGRAVDDIQDGDFAGAGDNLAGNIDESIGRQFDDEKGGGFADEAGNIIDDGLGAIGGGLDDAGDSVEDQFDNEQGGGFADDVFGGGNNDNSSSDDEGDQNRSDGFDSDAGQSYEDIFGGSNDQENVDSTDSRESLDNTITVKFPRNLQGGLVADPKQYRIKVSGQIEKTNNVETGFNPFKASDNVKESEVTGAVKVGGQDTYKYSGEVTEVDLQGNSNQLRVFKNGQGQNVDRDTGETRDKVIPYGGRLLTTTNIGIGVAAIIGAGYFLNSLPGGD